MEKENVRSLHYGLTFLLKYKNIQIVIYSSLTKVK